jgi:hypothetical protein
MLHSVDCEIVINVGKNRYAFSSSGLSSPRRFPAFELPDLEDKGVNGYSKRR